jgi:hypothetical protein
LNVPHYVKRTIELSKVSGSRLPENRFDRG